MELNLPEKIKLLRKEKNMTQKELAEKCHVPLDSVKSWEGGRRVPNDDAIFQLTQIFEVTKVFLTGEREEDKDTEERVWSYFLSNSERCLKDALCTACIDIAHYNGADPYELWGRYVRDSARMYGRNVIWPESKEDADEGK